MVSTEDVDPRLELDGVVGLVGGPEFNDVVELERDGAPLLGVLVGDVTLEGENKGEEGEKELSG